MKRKTGAGAIPLIPICALALTAAALRFYLSATLGVTLQETDGQTATMVGLAVGVAIPAVWAGLARGSWKRFARHRIYRQRRWAPA